MEPRAPLVVLGCGFTGVEAARLALADGRRVLGSTRTEARAAELTALGIEARVIPRLDAAAVTALVPAGAEVLITFPPDGVTDAALAPGLTAARALVYISSTAVYGEASGSIDESVPVDPSAPRAAPRLADDRATAHRAPWRGRYRDETVQTDCLVYGLRARRERSLR